MSRPLPGRGRLVFLGTNRLGLLSPSASNKNPTDFPFHQGFYDISFTDSKGRLPNLTLAWYKSFGGAKSTAFKCRGLIPRRFSSLGVSILGDLSIFVDESGSQEGESNYYIVTYVLHDQSEEIKSKFALYRKALDRKGLPDIPFHANPLMRGNDDYADMPLEDRKYLMIAFGMLVQKLPVRYKSFVYRSTEFRTPKKLQSLIRRDLRALLIEHIGHFQSFEHVKIYYDKGQPAVTGALEAAFDHVLSKSATVHCTSDFRAYRLAQVADYFCEIELAAAKYQHGEETNTDKKFFGSVGAFKKNWLKQARRKLIR